VEGVASPDAIGRVVIFPKLRNLRVNGGPATCAAFAQLPPLATLETVHFHGARDSGLDRFLSRHPSLRTLGLLNGKSRIEDDVFTAVAPLTGINVLELSGTFEEASFAEARRVAETGYSLSEVETDLSTPGSTSSQSLVPCER